MEKSFKLTVIKSFIFPFILLIVIWGIKIFEEFSGTSLSFLGVYPLSVKGLTGIITAPLVHGDFNHLISNSFALFILTFALFYFYRPLALQTFFLIYFLSGFWVWFFARQAFHIGASGLIYGLVAFLFFSGLFRKSVPLVAVSLTVVFLYGGIIWGILPIDEAKSWETHLTGFLAGVVIAFYFKKEGPQRKKYSWEEEEEDEVEAGDEDNNTPPDNGTDNIKITYHYRKEE